MNVTSIGKKLTITSSIHARLHQRFAINSTHLVASTRMSVCFLGFPEINRNHKLQRNIKITLAAGAIEAIDGFILSKLRDF